ncbi:MAG: Ig-like domain-containing protein [Lachnospiraceae bacterium]|nr:Ig-like domain-containing protein [Lachnospiraceae bacterium]
MKPRKKVTRILSLILGSLLTFSTMPQAKIAAFAADDDENTETAGSGIESCLIEDFLSEIDFRETSDTPEVDEADGTYNIWVGHTRITDTNKDNVLGDGTVSFNPADNTLTLNNAVISEATVSEDNAPSTGCNICSEQSLVIKGSATLSNGKNAIALADMSGKKTLTINADLTISAESSGIMAFGPDLFIEGGNINITGAEHSVGIMAYSRNAVISGGNIKISGDPMIGIFGITNLKFSGGTVEAVGSEAAVMMNYTAPTSSIVFVSPMGITEPEGAKVETIKIMNKDKLTDTLGIGDGSGNAVKSVKIDKKEGSGEDPVVDPTVWPAPILGGASALDPVPEIIPGTTTELYLVKGQKFTIGKDWKTADKKVVSINAKGVLTAKKEGSTTISCGPDDNLWEIKVNIVKPALNKKSISFTIEQPDQIKSEQISFTTDTANYDVLWTSADPDVAKVDEEGHVTAVSKGSTKITAYVNGSAYTCKVSVKEKAAAAHRTLHIAAGGSKALKLTGLKNPSWTESETGIVRVAKNKVYGDKAGFVTLSTSSNGVEYTVDVYVEDLTPANSENKLAPGKGANKYTLSLEAGKSTELAFADSVSQPVIFKSSKPDVAFIDENGNVISRSAGSCKFTAKIDKKTITISVTVK